MSGLKSDTISCNIELCLCCSCGPGDERKGVVACVLAWVPVPRKTQMRVGTQPGGLLKALKIAQRGKCRRPPASDVCRC